MLKEISLKPTEKEKIELLRKYNCQALREVLKYACDENLAFFTTEVPKYIQDQKTPIGMSYNTLFNECRRLYIFTSEEVERKLTNGKSTNLNRKNQILSQMLENIHPEEAKVLECLIRRDFFKKYNINKTLVKKAIPNFAI